MHVMEQNKNEDRVEVSPVEEINLLIQQRQQKVEQLREMGVNPYSNGFVPTHCMLEIQNQFSTQTPSDGEHSKDVEYLSEENFSVAGRIIEHRSFGKAVFMKLSDRSGTLQVYVRKDKIG